MMTTHATTRCSRFAAVLLALTLLGSACGDDDTSASSSDGALSDGFVSDGGSGAEPPSRPDSVGTDGDDGSSPGEAQDGGGAADGGNVTDPAAVTPADFGRSIVYTATTVVEVDDVAAAASQAKAAVAALGGLLFGEKTEAGDRSRTTLEFRVLPADFQEALGRLGGLGRLESQEVSADDVTERVVDLRSRIATSEVSVERLRDLLARATVLEDIARLETELLNREISLETLRGQLRTLEDQVDLATIWLTLHEPDPAERQPSLEYEVAFAEGDDAGQNCGSAFDELEVDEGDPLTVCVTLTNTGNTALGDIEIRDDGLDLRGRDFAFVDGEGDLVLAPEATVVAWAVLDAPAAGQSSVRVAAVAYDEDGKSLRIGAQTERVDRAVVRFVEDTSLPGVVDALVASWGVLVLIGYVLVLALAALVPFSWLLWVGWQGRRRWRNRRRSTPQSPAVIPPPPPAPPVAVEE